MRGGLTRRMVVASVLLALVVGGAFAVLLSSVADLRASERLALRAEEVLAVANRLERLVVDLETGERGFVITGQERFLQPWYQARAALPGEAGTLELLLAGNPEQQALARRITQATASYVRDYSVPLVTAARRDPATARTEAATDEGKRRTDAIRAEFDHLVATERGLAATREQRSAASAQRAVVAAAAGLGGSVVLILLFAGYLTRAIVQPVRRAAAMAGRLAGGLAEALDELRELSRGIHPAVLSEGGLRPALKALARRSVVPVELDVDVPGRLPEPVEVAAYYVVSEALANAAKHAHASVAQVEVRARGSGLHLSVRDDGVGGAFPERGTGIVGLTDQVKALGGTITVHSPTGQGTRLEVELPIDLDARLEGADIVQEALTHPGPRPPPGCGGPGTSGCSPR